MKFMLILFLFPLSSAFCIDTGDGSDGACKATTHFLVASKRNYNCTTLDIDGPLNLFKGAAGDPVVIKVLGSATISFPIDLSGNAGDDGNASAGVAGGSSGAGGYAGGNSTLANGVNGGGPGGGVAGKFVAPADPASYGGGGGGGSYKTQAATQPVAGFNSGGDPSSAGSNPLAIISNEDAFDSAFIGGQGGAAGGGGFDGTASCGSSGGGGGGALRIVAGGDIILDAAIISNGGNGGGFTGPGISGGGGGGGSGGAVWFQAAGELSITLNGSISAVGGLKGTNLFTIAGGDGGDGGIRLDDGDGNITIDPLATITPSHLSRAFTPTVATSLPRQYNSSVSCARIAIDDDQMKNSLLNILIGMMITSLSYLFVSRKGKI